MCKNIQERVAGVEVGKSDRVAKNAARVRYNLARQRTFYYPHPPSTSPPPLVARPPPPLFVDLVGSSLRTYLRGWKKDTAISIGIHHSLLAQRSPSVSLPPTHFCPLPLILPHFTFFHLFLCLRLRLAPSLLLLPRHLCFYVTVSVCFIFAYIHPPPILYLYNHSLQLLPLRLRNLH